MALAINTKLGELTKGTWVIVEGDKEYFQNFLVKAEEDKVNILYVNGETINPVGYVVGEGIFKYDTKLATKTLSDLTVEEFVFDLIESSDNTNSSDLIYMLLIETEVAAKNYPQFKKMQEFVHTADFANELPKFITIDGVNYEVEQ